MHGMLPPALVAEKGGSYMPSWWPYMGEMADPDADGCRCIRMQILLSRKFLLDTDVCQGSSSAQCHELGLQPPIHSRLCS